jgi:hypothetical protein
MPRKLKVFRTAIGFHDAYVAAPSQKAALEAWGSDANLFARGMAEEVTDEALAREPLASPGKVIRRLRGTAEEQIAALPKDRTREAEPEPDPARRPPKAKAPKPKPRPDRTALDEAERAIDDADEHYEDARKDLKARQAELDRERRATEADHERETAALQAALEKARSAYERAMERWRE